MADEEDPTRAFTASLRDLVAPKASAKARGPILASLLADLAAQKLRDLEPDPPLMEALLALQLVAWEDFALGLCKAHMLLNEVLQLPELVAAAPIAAPYVTSELLRRRSSVGPPVRWRDVPADGDDGSLPAPKSAARVAAAACCAAPPVPPAIALSSASPATRSRSTRHARTPHWAYRGARLRGTMRAQIGAALLALASGGARRRGGRRRRRRPAGRRRPPPGIRPLLEVLCSIIRSIGPTPTKAHHSLMRDVLCPLHRPSARLDETAPALLYHEPLATASSPHRQAAAPPRRSAASRSGWPGPREELLKRSHCCRDGAAA